MEFLRRLGLVIANAAILWFYSEFMFYGNLLPRHTAIGYAINFVYYAVITYAFLCVVYAFRVRSIWALYLAGGVYGWLIEGVAVSTMYDNIPFQIPWTGLSWHSLLVVLVGWYLVRRTLLENDYGKTVVVCGGIAFFWATWAAYWWTQKDFGWAPVASMHPPRFDFWWVPEGFQGASLEMFAFSALLFSLFLIAGHWLAHALRTEKFHPTKAEYAILAVVAVGWFGWRTLPDKPYALLILLPVAIITLAALWKNRHDETRASVLAAFEGKVRPLNFWLLWLIPLLAIFGYAQYQWQDVQIYMNKILGSLTINGAVVLYLLSLARIFTRGRAQTDR